MSKITEKLNRILSICEPVMTADRMQNVSIEVRDIKTILDINANKTMNDVLEAVKGNNKYVITYTDSDSTKYYLTFIGGTVKSIEDAYCYKTLEEISKAINEFKKLYTALYFKIEEYKGEIKPITEPCKKQELQEKMSSLIANGENIPSEMHDKWNEFVEGESI